MATETGHGCSTSVEGDFFDVVRALMFGNSALEDERALGKAACPHRQWLYNDLVSAGADGMELYRGIQDYRAVNGDLCGPVLPEKVKSRNETAIRSTEPDRRSRN